MRISRATVAAAALLLATPGIAAAPDQRAGRPELFRNLTDCRAVKDDKERLACYDARVAALDAAEARNDVVVVDRAEVRKARRSLFGLTLPRLALFGDKDDAAEAEEFNQIESTIKSATQRGYDGWAFVLEDGARWVQTDSKPLAVDPRPGQPIRIRKAALGSFMANVNGQIAIRVKREN